ncbi:MAG: CDP-diacylglycerol--glycerol-3-phosphate 3-phosphatidyltransferase [Opitutaceae bacterium]
MNLPNAITLSRIPTMFVIAWLMYCHWTGAALLAFVLFLAAAGGDWIDGYLARSRGQITAFGKLMDSLADKIMVLGLVIAFVGHPRENIWMPLALITLVREFLVTGMRMVAASKGIIVAADRGGKSKTVTQLVALGFLLLAPAVGRDLSVFAGRDFGGWSWDIHQIGEGIFWIGTFLAVWSGWRYIVQFKDVVFAEAGQ